VQEDVTGLRFGEAIGCIYSNEMEGGCGTSKYCTKCGAGQAIKKTKDTGENCSKECRITAKIADKEIHYDLQINTRTFEYNSKIFILVFIKDLADKKKRQTLERFFYHDVLNIVTAIDGFSGMLPEIEDKEELKEITDSLQLSARNLMNEILAQRDLSEAENNSLSPFFKQVNLNDIIKDVYAVYKNHDLVKGKIFLMEASGQDIILYTDPVLLNRSLGNLVKNAIEAKGERIVIYPEIMENRIKINVKNDGVIPVAVQLQIFQRSFSTKGSIGRGIGTHSVKLLIEQYLKGKVYFKSSPETQTVFTIELPLSNEQ
jgi:signal transduction histidine kinase